MEKEMNLINKLANARLELLEMNLCKSGHNEYVGFDYFELSDILPAIIKLEAKYGYTSVFNFGPTFATLHITDNIDDLEFTCPWIESNLKGAQGPQNIGSSITYIKRYLICAAYLIEEYPDILDATIGNDAPVKRPEPMAVPSSKRAITPAQIDYINKLGCNIENICLHFRVDALEDLTTEQANEVIQRKKNNG